MKRPLLLIAAAGALVLAGATRAEAHTEFQPASATVGSTAELNLFVEDESSTAGTTKVELVFPEALTVSAAEAPSGWTVTAQGGSIGAEATGLTWSGPALDDSANLALTLGPLPADPAALQFKVLQTYDDGRVDRWIGEAGSDDPGPVLELTAAGATTTTGADEHGAHDHGSGGHDTETTMGDHGMDHGTDSTTATTAAAAEDDDDSNTGAIVGIVIAAIVLGGGLVIAAKARKKGATGS